LTGLFIAFEGGEGSGKSTQAGILAERLRSVGRVVAETAEPGGTRTGIRIRKLLLSSFADRERMPPIAEALLFLADRNVHVERIISPRLADGQVVICDRYALSTLVYQGVGRGLDVTHLAEVNRWASLGLVPDLTIVLDVDPEVGLTRAIGRAGTLDRIESEPVEFHQRIREGFLTLAAGVPGTVVIDANREVGLVADDVKNAVDRVRLDRLAALNHDDGVTDAHG
jgi:dTMP kinase